jgi:hypothetical protein
VSRRAALVSSGLLLIAAAYFAALFVPVAGGCASASEVVDICPIQPWATLAPIGLFSATFFGVIGIGVGLLRGRPRN